MPSNEHTTSDEVIRGHISPSFDYPIPNGNYGWAVKIQIKPNSGDIDNLGISLLKNLEGIAHEDIHDIRVLHMIRNTIATDDTSVIMELYSLDSIY